MLHTNLDRAHHGEGEEWAGPAHSLKLQGRQQSCFPELGMHSRQLLRQSYNTSKTENCRPPKKFCVKPPLLRGVNIVVFLGVTEALIRCCVVACKNVTKLSHTQLFSLYVT